VKGGVTAQHLSRHSENSISQLNVVEVPADEHVTKTANEVVMGMLISKPGVYHSPQLEPAVNGICCDHMSKLELPMAVVVIAAAPEPPADRNVVLAARAMPESCEATTAVPPPAVPTTLAIEKDTEALDGKAAAPITPQRMAEMLQSQGLTVSPARIGTGDVLPDTEPPVNVGVVVSKTPTL
jgi:hypothetical protein